MNSFTVLGFKLALISVKQSNIFPSKANEGEIEHTAKVTEKRIIVQFVLRLFCKRLTYCFPSIVVNWIHKTMETFPISIVRSYLA